MANPSPLDSLYPQLGSAHGEGDFGVLDESLEPRTTDVLYDLVAEAGPSANDHILDVGCGSGRHAIRLVEHFGCRVTGIDPVAGNLDEARAAAVEASVAEQVTFQQGSMDSVPATDQAFDWIWSRDMLEHVPDVPAAAAECARVLRPGGRLMLYTTFATDLMAPGELAQVTEPLALSAKSLSRPGVEAAFAAVGFVTEQTVELGSESLQAVEEREGRYSRELMRLARMLTDPGRYRQALGADRYDMALGLYRWSLYILIGKLSNVAYLLTRSADPHDETDSHV